MKTFITALFLRQKLETISLLKTKEIITINFLGVNIEHDVCEKGVYVLLSKHIRGQICIYWMIEIMLTIRKEESIGKKMVVWWDYGGLPFLLCKISLF